MRIRKVQHVTDPSTCISCGACELACSLLAIQNIGGRFCIDDDQCKGCGLCISACPTGAADSYVSTEHVFSPFQQAEWQSLPDPVRLSGEERVE
ncbi:MAG: 4Fe-4S binding protein [Candidatus Obscuribacterales bacterium]|nr:4Fe-4S binding protein [Candidatus Obscuribacterales bacterium]